MKELNALRELLELALFDMMTPEHAAHVAAAEKAYRTGLGDQAEGLFLVSYMLHDHKMANGRSYFENYKLRMGSPVLNHIQKTRFGVYEVVRYASGLYLKDPLSKTDFAVVDLHEVDPGRLIVGRLIMTAEGAFLDDDFVEYPASYLESFKKSILEKYNEFIAKGTPMMIDEFIADYPLVLMTFADLLTDIENETYEDVDNYVVYQAVYLTPNQQAVMDFIRADKDFEITLDENGYLVANLYADPEDQESELLSEVVIDGNRIEADCLDEFRLDQTKSKLEALLHDLIAHFKDEVLTLEDLME